MLRRALRTKGRFGAFSITPNRPPSHRLHDYNTPAPKIPEHLVKNFPASRPRAGICGKFFYNLFRIFRNGRVIEIVPTGRGAVWSDGKGSKSEDPKAGPLCYVFSVSVSGGNPSPCGRTSARAGTLERSTPF